MSIVALKRASLCGMARSKAQVLDDLQALGCLHLVALADLPETDGPAEPPEDAHRALRFLGECPRKRHQIRNGAKFDFESCIRKTLAIRQQIRRISDARDITAARIRDLEPWGDFDLPPEDALLGYKLWFYIVPLALVQQIPRGGLIWEIVHRDNRFSYVAVVAQQEPELGIMPVARSHTGRHSLSNLRDRLNTLELELEDLRAERESMTRWIWMISRNLARAEDRGALDKASRESLDAGEVFVVQGWLPSDQIAELTAFAEQNSLALMIQDPDPNDQPPTLLENPESWRAGEDLVNFYQTPGYWDWDPAVPVFFSFALFFAMILSDAGYAALIAIVLMLNWRRIGASPAGPRGRMLASVLAGSSLLWGIVVGSYFGVAPPADSLAGELKLLDVNDFDSMMRLSIGIGVLHLAFANLLRAHRLRKSGLAALVPIGWILVMFGAFFLWLDQSLDSPPDWVSTAGKFKFGLGLAAVFVFSGRRKLGSLMDFAVWLLDGLRGLTQITRIFGDVLSYLRLFALGLASASLALTFNGLASEVRETVEGPGLLFSLLILLVGHGLNLLLSLMSAVVHGMRLNCIEFFNWGLSDEGYPFKAFSKKEIHE